MTEKLVYFLIENFSSGFIGLLLLIFSITVYRVFHPRLAFARFEILITISILASYWYSYKDNVFFHFVFNLLLDQGFVELNSLIVATKLFLRLFTLYYCVIVIMSIESYRVTTLEYYLIYLATVLGFAISVYDSNLLLLHFTVELTTLYVYVRRCYIDPRKNKPF